MASYTIANITISDETLCEYYRRAKQAYTVTSWDDLDTIFQIALNNRDRFPGINLTGQKTPELYIDRWVKGYVDARNSPPSTRIAKPKSACTDPAIRTIVKATQGLSDEAATAGETNHNLFMSAENIQGNLLEEYISLRTRDYGFIWCDGNVLRAIDFCNSDGTVLLQIKNKSNTENSSSSNIREGTSIEKWYRLGTRSQAGRKIPCYRWNELNELINNHRTKGLDLPPCNMNETDYQAFLIEKASANHRLITNL